MEAARWIAVLPIVSSRFISNPLLANCFKNDLKLSRVTALKRSPCFIRVQRSWNVGSDVPVNLLNSKLSTRFRKLSTLIPGPSRSGLYSWISLSQGNIQEYVLTFSVYCSDPWIGIAMLLMVDRIARWETRPKRLFFPNLCSVHGSPQAWSMWSVIVKDRLLDWYSGRKDLPSKQGSL